MADETAADQHPSPAAAELGVPGLRKGLVRRLLVRIAWPVLGRQIDFNHATADELQHLKAHLATQQEALRSTQQVWRSELLRLESAQQRLQEVIDTCERALSEQQEAIDLSRERAMARSMEGMGIVRKEIGELSLELSQLRATYSMTLASILPKVAALELAFDGHPKATRDEGTRPEPGPRPSPPVSRELDAFYAALGEAFRGPEALVRSRVREYVKDLDTVRSLGKVLDVGCGRGEMLQVLEEAGIEAYGIDTNSLCVERCRARGLEVELADALKHLADVPTASLGAVTAIHLVEHLTTEELIEFLDLAMAALKPGGLLILETPNPENVLVSSTFFYLDPSHRHPLPPPLLQFVVASRGIIDIEIRRLDRSDEVDVSLAIPSPAEDEPWFGDLKRVVDVLNTWFACAADYAILATKS